MMPSFRHYLQLTATVAALLASAHFTLGCNENTDSTGKPAQPSLYFKVNNQSKSRASLNETPMLTSSTIDVEVINQGNIDAVFSDLASDMSAVTSPFAISGEGTAYPCSAAIPIEPTESCWLRITFNPNYIKQDTWYSEKLELHYISSADAKDPASAKIFSSSLDIDARAIRLLPRLEFYVGNATQVDFSFVPVLTNKSLPVKVTNTGKSGAILGDITNDELSLSSPFNLETPDSAPACTSQMHLAVNQSCWLKISFSPQSVDYFDQRLTLYYTAEIDENAPAPNDVFTANLFVSGIGKLDCSLSPILQDAFSKGTEAANAKMADEITQGTNEGAALTYEQGVSKGYSDGYKSTYDPAYNGINGYDKGYAEGFSNGLSSGKTDISSCNQGTLAGQKEGYAAGSNDGDYDGYQDGYAQGKPAGSTIGATDGLAAGIYQGKIDGTTEGTKDADTKGYNSGNSAGNSDGYDDGNLLGYPDGYSAGESACMATNTGGSGSGSRFFMSTRNAITQPLIDGCYNQGYQKKYSDQPYWDAYKAARAANDQYQEGYKEGLNTGKNQGTTDGTAKGYTDGKDKGKSDGFETGASEIFKTCSANAYPVGYTDGYANSYNPASKKGYDAGYADGYNVSYDLQYEVGHSKGYKTTYSSAYDGAYDANYSEGYTAGYNEGFKSGYDFGYGNGYDDGYNSLCTGYYSMSPVPAPMFEVMTKRVPTPRMISDAKLRAKFLTRTSTKTNSQKTSKSTKRTENLKTISQFGVGENWYTEKSITSRKLGQTVATGFDHFIASRLSPSMTESMSDDGYDRVQSFRGLHNKKSLRSQLKIDTFLKQGLNIKHLRH